MVCRTTWRRNPLPPEWPSGGKCGPSSCQWIVHILSLARTDQVSLTTPEDYFGGHGHVVAWKIIGFSGRRGKKLCGDDPDNEMWVVFQLLRHKFRFN